MSIRANSLRNLCSDGVYFMLAMSLVAFAATALAQEAQPRIVRAGDVASDRRLADDVASDRRLADDHIDRRLNTDDNENVPSGDPTESAAGKREAMILGMKLFERSSGDIRVLDVAATSPAWDAGIRKGDRIKALDGIKPKALAPWIDDVGKVLKDTEDGHAVAAEVEREGEPLALRIKVPVSNAGEVRDARQEAQAIAKMRAGQQGQVSQGQPGAVPLGYGDDRTDGYASGYAGGYGGWGMGGFFGDDDTTAADDANSDDRMATSAVAPLMAVNTLGRNQTQSGGQVGMAGFQNNGQGVDAMVVVRGLPQGSYQVGIGTGDEVAAGAGFDGLNAAGENQFGLNPALEGTDFSGGGADRNQNGIQNNNQNGGANDRNLVNPSGAPRGQFNPSGAARPEQQQPGFAPQGGQAPVVPQGNLPGAAPATGGAAPAGGGGGGAAGAGEGASLANPANAVLAQQLDPGQVGQGTGAQQQPVPQGLQNPANTGTAGGRQNNGAGQQTRSGNPYDPRENSERQRQAEQNANPLSNPTGTPFVASIGVLQVGPDGTGTVQGQLEGVAVRNLAGMNVIVQSTNWQGQGGAAVDPRVAQGAQANGRQQPGQAVRPGQGQPQQAGQQLGPQGQPAMRGAQGIVAMGQIQLRNSGNTATGVDPQTGLQNGQQPVNEGAAQQQRQISNPGEDFNPSR